MVTNGPSAAQHVRESAERHVLAVFDAERVCSPVFRGNGIRAGSAAFFDPQICPSMWERANAVMHHLQTSHEIEYVDRTAPGTAPYDPDDAEMRSAVFVHFVNDPNVLFVFRDRAERLSWLWGAAWEEGRCNVTQAVGCTGDTGPTAFIPTLRGQFLVCFEGCGPCHEHLDDIAVTNLIIAEADAHLAFDSTGLAAVDKWRAIRAGQEGV